MIRTVLLLSVFTMGCSTEERRHPPLPPAPMGGSGSHLSEREQELKARGGETSSEEDLQRRERAFRALKSGRSFVAAPTHRSRPVISPGTAMGLPMRVSMAPSFELLTAAEVESLKTALAPCVKKRTVVKVDVSPKGVARLTGGQILDSGIVECLAGKLQRVSFFEGPLRRGRVVLP